MSVSGKNGVDINALSGKLGNLTKPTHTSQVKTGATNEKMAQLADADVFQVETGAPNEEMVQGRTVGCPHPDAVVAAAHLEEDVCTKTSCADKCRSGSTVTTPSRADSTVDPCRNGLDRFIQRTGTASSDQANRNDGSPRFIQEEEVERAGIDFTVQGDSGSAPMAESDPEIEAEPEPEIEIEPQPEVEAEHEDAVSGEFQ
jgi:hypothetical protein